MINFSIVPPLIAHRGASALAPENTMAAFYLAANSGAKFVEFDVHLTHDGVPVVIHDDTLNRTTDGKGAVADASWADMQRLDAGSWFDPKYAGEKVPSFAEVLRFALDSGLRPMIEIKPCRGREQATTMITLIEAAKIWPRDHTPPAVLSFDPQVLGIAARLQPHWPRLMSFNSWTNNWHEQAASVEAEMVGMDNDYLTAPRMEMISRSKEPALLVFTVNDAARAKQLLDQGARAIFTDNPAELIKAL